MTRTQLFSHLVVCLLGSTLELSAFQTPPAAKSKDETKSKEVAALHGKVTNAQTNDALKKVTLILAKTSGGSNSKAETDDKGEFSFEEIQPGRYYLLAERTGYTRQASTLR